MAASPDTPWEKPPVPRSPPSKFRPPTVGAPFVARDRLTERIRQATGAKLVLVQAPAGFGTTTLLRDIYDLFTAVGYAIVWLTLDTGDNDLDRFMSCLSQAFAQLGHAQSALAGGLARREGDGFDLMDAIVSTPLPFMLILDGFEHLQNPAAVSVVQQLTELLGPQQKLVIGSREQTMLSVGRLRARQQLLEIDASQLRFTQEETRQFLCDKRGLRLDSQDVERLHQVTGGWAAALWLASLALESSDDPKRFIRTFSGSNTVVASYLAEDVLAQKPRHLQDFILQTSILQKFNAESCNAVTGRSDSREMLQEIERSNMFITALDEQCNWYSYHPLFAGFLHAQLERQCPGLAPVLHRRAASWYMEQGRATHAIDHAMASGDKELVLQLLEQHAESLFLQGRVRLLVRWCDALDRSSMARHPKLMSVYAWALIHINRSAEALTLLETVTNPDGASPLPHPTYHVLRTFSLVMMDRIQETAPMWDDPHILGSAAQEPLLRSMLMIGCAYYYATIGRFQDARLLLDQATQEQPAVGPLFGIAVAGYVRSMLDLAQGKLRAAIARLLALIGDESQLRMRAASARYSALVGFGGDLPEPRHGADSGFASLYLAEVLYEMDSLGEARRLLKQYLPLVKDAGIPDQLIASHLIHARILRAEGNATDALQTLLELEHLGMARMLPRIVDMARLEQARLAILDDNMESARALLALVGNAPAWQRRSLQMIADDIETPFLGGARLQIHSGQATSVLPLLKEHLQDAYGRGRLRYALRVKVLYALALSLSGQRNPALRAIRETLQDAMAEGFVRVFKDEGPTLLALVRDMLEGTKDVANAENLALLAFAERILRTPQQGMRSPLVPQPVAAGAPAKAHLAAETELTSRELDVLMLLAQGNGNQMIAEKLFVSVTTVKTHLRNINLKLGAHNRTEAISLARKLCIIS
ncbi:MAG TPA: LuxR C-terminal-related transcriptional regulator [Noviherbaspirillum sp.]|uniref:LuxR C-terminal-related transcriptional regulator n=1 Tax=Noviherbaspirillum sp. TaxID=1926288 RepID=UPI002B47EB33|nr:LuxR C-terminal-related transcriptional regulator [Noviherbaspirillum sp.]HJV86197.1 LuxR C-terminal-related transcriptional regulator [Noviherbaspirillum sp.]